jgi:hypothetical protein
MYILLSLSVLHIDRFLFFSRNLHRTACFQSYQTIIRFVVLHESLLYINHYTFHAHILHYHLLKLLLIFFILYCTQGSLFTMELYCTPKSQYTTVKHTMSIRRRAIGPLAHHNGTSAHSPSLACHLPARRSNVFTVHRINSRAPLANQ